MSEPVKSDAWPRPTTRAHTAAAERVYPSSIKPAYPLPQHSASREVSPLTHRSSRTGSFQREASIMSLCFSKALSDKRLNWSIVTRAHAPRHAPTQPWQKGHISALSQHTLYHTLTLCQPGGLTQRLPGGATAHTRAREGGEAPGRRTVGWRANSSMRFSLPSSCAATFTCADPRLDLSCGSNLRR
jgi:hypothetical protein